jgi:hypothetical protein
MFQVTVCSLLTNKRGYDSTKCVCCLELSSTSAVSEIEYEIELTCYALLSKFAMIGNKQEGLHESLASNWHSYSNYVRRRGEPLYTGRKFYFGLSESKHCTEIVTFATGARTSDPSSSFDEQDCICSSMCVMITCRACSRSQFQLVEHMRQWYTHLSLTTE